MKTNSNENISGIRYEVGMFNGIPVSNNTGIDGYQEIVPSDQTMDTHRYNASISSTGISGHGYKSLLALSIILTILSSGCNRLREEFPIPKHESKIRYQQTNLVSDITGFNAARIDTNLVNAWGISLNPSGIFWLSSNGKGLTVVYDKNGNQLRAPVNMNAGGPNGGTPSGAVFNGTTDFIIPSTGEVSRFIFSAEDGKIYAWRSGDSTRTVADRSAWGAVHKGLELASNDSINYLYAPDFHNGAIDVFDKNFNYVSMPFKDTKIPKGFAPFNIRLIDGYLFVTYAKQLLPDKHDDEKGPGNGYVDIFKTDGSFVSRMVTRGVLNSPWGIEKAPEAFGQGKSSILVGNFGDGKINVFEEYEGEFLGDLKVKGGDKSLVIDGLWGITFPDGRIPGDDPNKLYFTAGPDDESHSLFGYITQ
jgi:uncharacterized protein (TIGR03118 family)